MKVSYNRTIHVIGCFSPAFSHGIPADPLIRFRTHLWVTPLSIFGVGFSDGSNLQSHRNVQTWIIHLDYLILCLGQYDARLGYAFLIGIAGWLRKSHARLFWYHEFCHTSFETGDPRNTGASSERGCDHPESRFPFMEVFGLGFLFSLYGDIWVRFDDDAANEFTKGTWKIVFDESATFVDNPKSEHLENISLIMVSLLILR
jgi:hypothetical protein